MYRIMIVDDEPRIANSIYDLIESYFEFESYVCYSALNALDIIKKMRFDIVITDIAMPEMDGLNLLQKTRNIWPKCHFIILTAYSNFDYAYESLRYERVDYLLKAEGFQSIVDCVQKNLDAIRKEREREEKLELYDTHMEELNDSMCSYFLKRIIIQGMPLPTQEDIRECCHSLYMEKPVYFALMALDNLDQFAYQRTAHRIVKYLRSQVFEQGLNCHSYTSTSMILVVIQAIDEKISNENLTAFLLSIFDALPQVIEKNTGYVLSVVCPDRFMQWEDISKVYQQASVQLENIRNDSGMIIFQPQKTFQVIDGNISFPSMEQLSILWEMIKCGDIEHFDEMLRTELKEIEKNNKGMTQLPESVITAIRFLISEAICLYQPNENIVQDFENIIDAHQYHSFQEWCDDVVACFDSIVKQHKESCLGQKEWVVIQVNQLIEKNYMENLTLTMLAQEVNYSPSYLSRLYKNTTGTNIMTYLSDVRISKAKMMLRNTNDRISDIATKTGFCSTKYFNRVFKKVVGISASEYRGNQ